jgi:hypothetical protein
MSNKTKTKQNKTKKNKQLSHAFLKNGILQTINLHSHLDLRQCRRGNHHRYRPYY